MVPADSHAERERLLLMARKLYRFVTPIGVLAIGFGLWLWFGYGFAGGWLHAKVALVVGLAAYHVWCGRLLAGFASGSSTKSHVWFRFFNEVPVLVLVAICILTVVKPI
jgi:putative membrane protein